MAEPKKVYDYRPEAVERQIVDVLRKRNRESTVTDIIASSGLPKYQVKDMMNLVIRDYAGQLRVTESGELLYYFPQGLRNQRRGPAATFRRIIRKTLQITGKVLALLFKIWIMVMLIGYFVLFIALLLLAMLASIAGSANSRDSDRGRDRIGGFGGMFLTVRVIELFVTLWLYSGTPNRGNVDAYGRPRRKPKGRPLHQSVFAFVFGDETAVSTWPEREKQEFIKFIQSEKGVITLEELMHLTGRDRAEAQSLMNSCLVEFEGEPDVTESGTLIYRFPELMRSRERSTEGTHLQREFIPLIPFNKNKGNINKWVGFLNGFNLVFGGYFLYYSFAVSVLSPQHVLDRFYGFVLALAHQISTTPHLLVAVALGIIPVAFSFLFYLVPVVRRISEHRKNEQIRQQNLRKRVLANILAGPDSVDPEEIVPQLPEEKPANWRAVVERSIQDVAGEVSPEVVEKRAANDGNPAAYIYHLPELKRQLSDIEAYRRSVQLSQFDVGKTVFDSGSDDPISGEKS